MGEDVPVHSKLLVDTEELQQGNTVSYDTEYIRKHSTATEHHMAQAASELLDGLMVAHMRSSSARG